MQRLMLWVLRLMLVAVGAVLALAVLCGIAALFLVWSVKRAWARLTGRPVAPWVLRTDPLAVWRQTAGFRRGSRGFPPDVPAASHVEGSAAGGAGSRRSLEDVTDVTPK